MARYYVNNKAQENGDHEVHKEVCYWLSLITSKKDLGLHSSCSTAVKDAKKTFFQSNGCKTCSPECHTS